MSKNRSMPVMGAGYLSPAAHNAKVHAAKKFRRTRYSSQMSLRKAVRMMATQVRVHGYVISWQGTYNWEAFKR